jgi:hypothetical protein
MKTMLYAMLIINLTFPKGGYVISGIPITFGYVIVGFWYILYAVKELKNKRILKFNKIYVGYILLIILLDTSMFSIIVSNGYAETGYYLSLVVNFILLPAIILTSPKMVDGNEMMEFYRKIFPKIIRFLVIFGLFNFALQILTFEQIEITGLTEPFGSEISFEEKYNDRGGIFKLASTYGNGNIYAICILMLLPLYENIENRKWFIYLCKLSVVLTLSRTAWLGLFAYETLKIFLYRRNIVMSALKYLITILAVGLSVAITISNIGNDINFIFDKELGGRADQLLVFENMSIISVKEFVNIKEIVYLSILEQFGIYTLLVFIILFLYPIAVGFLVDARAQIMEKEAKAILIGLILYPLLCIADGAIQLIPVMFIYWLLVSILMSLKFNK